MTLLTLPAPFQIFLGDEHRKTYVKTGQGLIDWRRADCLAQFRLTENTCRLDLPDMTISEAKQAGVQSLLVGTAQIGGSIPENWLPVFIEAAEHGIHVVAGLHTRLSSVPELVAAAEKGNAQLIDIRVPPNNIPVATGKKRSGKRLLTVGTDCALGKKYTALQLSQDMTEMGMSVEFKATGQTGIMIAGQGLPIDSVVGDFISGAAELLTPDTEGNHWDVIEGQGAIYHPGYGAVSHGLLVGSQPDAFVVCHEAGRECISGWEHYPLPSIGEVIERTISIGRQTNPEIQCVGISVNTSSLNDDERNTYLMDLSSKYQLPCVDPLRHGTRPILIELQQRFLSN